MSNQSVRVRVHNINGQCKATIDMNLGSMFLTENQKINLEKSLELMLTDLSRSTINRFKLKKD